MANAKWSFTSSTSSSFHPPFFLRKPPLLLPSFPITFHSKHSSLQSFKCPSTPKPDNHNSVSDGFGIVSTYEHSDGSVIFRFGLVSEISEEVEKEESAVSVKESETENTGDEVISSLNEVELSTTENLNILSERSSEEAVSNVISSDETHEQINFNVLTPVSISQLEYVVQDEASSGNSLIISEECSQEDSEGETERQSVEPDTEANSRFTSQNEPIHFKVSPPISISQLAYAVQDEASGRNSPIISEEFSEEDSEGETEIQSVEPDVESNSRFMSQTETIYFKVSPPVRMSQLEYVVQDEASGNSSTIISEEFSQEDSEGQTERQSTEPDIEVNSSFISKTDGTGEDISIQLKQESHAVYNGDYRDNAEAVSMSGSVYIEVATDKEPTDTAVDQERIELSTDNEVDEKSIENVVGEESVNEESVEKLAHNVVIEDTTPNVADEEPIDQLTYDAAVAESTNNAVHEEQAPAAVNEEVAPVAVTEELTLIAVNEGATPVAVNEEPTPIAINGESITNAANEEPMEQLTSNEAVEEQTPIAVDDELTPIALHEEPTPISVNEEPTPIPVNEESIPDVVNEESTRNSAVDGRTCVAVDELPVKSEVVENLKLLDGNLPLLHFTEKLAEDVESSSNGDVPMPLAAESQVKEATDTQEEVPNSGFYLLSGAASLLHPSKALTGRKDAYFIDQNWLGIADGVGQWSFEGTSGQYAQELINNCGKIVTDSKSILINDPVEVLGKASTETLSPGSSTALIAHCDGQALQVANIGDSGFLIIRNGTVFKKSVRMEREFNFPLQIEKGDNPSDLAEVYEFDMEEGDVIIAASDGLFDNVYDQEIASFISTSIQSCLKPQEMAEMLAARAQEVGQSIPARCPFADAAQAAGYAGYTGGKLDNVTVIVSILHPKSTSELQSV